MRTLVIEMETESRKEAKKLGGQYSDWDADTFIQSAEAVNDVAPELRRLAGFIDGGMGTYTVAPINLCEEELGNNLNEMWEVFWEGFYEAQASCEGVISDVE